MKKRKYYYVYETENLVNGKKYIGKHHSNINPEQDNYLGSGNLIKSAIKKYGKENFKRRILCMCDSEEEVFEMESYYIDMVLAYDNPNYYNLIPGGKGTPSKYISVVIQSVNNVDVNTFYDIYDASEKLGISAQNIYSYCLFGKKFNKTYGGYKFRTEKRLRNLLSNQIFQYDSKYFDVKEKIELENGIWTEEDDEFIRTSKGILTIDQMADKLNRTVYSISNRIRKLGLTKDIKYFSKNEDEFLISNYEKYGAEYCAKELNRSQANIRSRANYIGLYKGKNEYTDDEIKYIIENYDSLNSKEIAEYLNRPYQSIKAMASKYGVSKDISYSKYEISFLINNYSKYGASKCAEILGRSKKALTKKANALGLYYDKSSKKTSKYKYVYLDNGRWCVSMRVDGKVKKFGSYKTEEEAVTIAMQKAKEFGKNQ